MHIDMNIPEWIVSSLVTLGVVFTGFIIWIRSNLG
jgi:hypothetical protein